MVGWQFHVMTESVGHTCGSSIYLRGGWHGLNALQINEVTGQQIVSHSRHDLYFATQDNDLWFSGDVGRSWQLGAQYEGNYFSMLRRVPTEADSRIVYTSCSPCTRVASESHYRNKTAWRNPARGYGHAIIIQKDIYTQLQDRETPASSVSLSITKNSGQIGKKY